MEITFIEKIKLLITSVRFWQITVATALVILGHYLPDQAFLWNTLAGFFAAVAGIGTLDKFSANFGNKAISTVAPEKKKKA